LFYTAFINKNNIFPQPDGRSRKIAGAGATPGAELFKMAQIMEGLDRTHPSQDERIRKGVDSVCRFLKKSASEPKICAEFCQTCGNLVHPAAVPDRLSGTRTK
jgi:hypothetical protein